ncbi:MAG: hypothetical protein LBR53_01400 [Deltaproteobacteria bacterium]|nr:hypothetical protein [Deltaproteobacteria bacterium]
MFPAECILILILHLIVIFFILVIILLIIIILCEAWGISQGRRKASWILG